MKINKIISAVLIFFAIVIIITLAMSYMKKSESFSVGTGRTTYGVTGESDLSACSVTTCDWTGATGTQYRSFSCTGPNGAEVDPSLCFGPSGALSSLKTLCSPQAGSCSSVNVSATFGWSEPLPTITGPSCAYPGYQYTQITKSKCKGLYDGIFYEDNKCAGDAPTGATSTVTWSGTSGSEPSCTAKAIDSIGLQTYHYSLNGISTTDNNSILGGAYSGSGAVTTQILRYATDGSKLFLPVTLSNGTISNKNTIIFPKGLSGYFIIMLIYPLSNGTNAISMTASASQTAQTNTSTGLEIVQNYFKSNNGGAAMHNTNDSTTQQTTFYYFLPILIKDDTVSSSVTFSCTSNLTNRSTEKYADLFVLQASSLPRNSICGNVSGKQPGFYGSNCYLGALPLMARYQFSSCTATNPFGSPTDLYSSAQISDTIGLTFTTDVASQVTVNIPDISKYTHTGSTAKDIYYMIIMNWYGSATGSSPYLTFASTGGDYSNSNGLRPFSLPITGTTTNAFIMINSSKNLCYCRILKLATNASSTFTISAVTVPGGTVTGDLVILQYNGTA